MTLAEKQALLGSDLLSIFTFDTAPNVRGFPSTPNYPLIYGGQCFPPGQPTGGITINRHAGELNAFCNLQNGVCYWPKIDNTMFHAPGGGTGALKIDFPSLSNQGVGGYFDTTILGHDYPHLAIGPDHANGGHIHFQYQYRTSNLAQLILSGVFSSLDACKIRIFGSVPPGNGVDFFGTDWTLASVLHISENHKTTVEGYNRDKDGAFAVWERNIGGTIYVQSRNGGLCPYPGGPANSPPCVLHTDNVWQEVDEHHALNPVGFDFTANGARLLRPATFNASMKGRRIYNRTNDEFRTITGVIGPDEVTLDAPLTGGTNKTVYISNYPNSTAQVWWNGALIHDRNDISYVWDVANVGFGQLRFQPHFTNKPASTVHADGFVWYDDLVFALVPVPSSNASSLQLTLH